jgi:hypothetical protein
MIRNRVLYRHAGEEWNVGRLGSDRCQRFAVNPDFAEYFLHQILALFLGDSRMLPEGRKVIE